TDAPLDDMIARLVESGKTAQFISVRPMFSTHVATAGADGVASSADHQQDRAIPMKRGVLVPRPAYLVYINPCDAHGRRPFARLSEKGELLAYRCEGFWRPMDTIKDKQYLDALVDAGEPPWRNTARHADRAPE